MASCVVFRDAKPARKEYRHFNIKTVVGANDFASMEEVIGRRYRRLLDEDAELPQLIVVTEARGSSASPTKPCCGSGSPTGSPSSDWPNGSKRSISRTTPPPYYLDRNSEALKVLMHIRDEAHRFGITFHRKKRSLAFIKSELESIPTLGNRSVEKLLQRFRTLSRIRTASETELSN